MRNMILATAILLTAGLGSTRALPPTMPAGTYYQRLANDWVRLYLRRNATDRDLLVIINQLRNGNSRDSIQANILASPEYFRLNNNNINAWGRSVVNDVLGRPITPYEQGLIRQINFNQGRYAAALTVLQSRDVTPPWWWGGW